MDSKHPAPYHMSISSSCPFGCKLNADLTIPIATCEHGFSIAVGCSIHPDKPALRLVSFEDKENG